MDSTKEERERVFDILKGIAICAVLVDHNMGLIYTSEYILALSRFSVNLFVFCAGVTGFIAMRRRNLETANKLEIGRYIGKRLKEILVPYTVATAFCVFVSWNWVFTLDKFMDELVHFSAAPPFYFVFFYVQLIIISPLLYRFISFALYRMKSWERGLFLLAEFAAVVGLAYWCTQHTLMSERLPLAKFLFGGSFLIMYFMGMVFAAYRKRITDNIKRVLFFFGGGLLAGYVWLSYFKAETMKAFYDCFNEAFPRLDITWKIYALIIVMVVWCGYTLLEKKKTSALPLLLPLEILGRFSLYIFLYHMWFIIVLRNTFFIKYSFFNDNLWLRRIMVLFIGGILPVILKALYDMLKQLLTKQYSVAVERSKQ